MTRCPSTSAVRPERNRSQPSMQSAPSAIAEISVITFAPSLPAPTRSPSTTRASTSASIPSRCASVPARTTPASATARSSSNATATPSSPTGPSTCTTKVTSCRRPRPPQSVAFLLLRRSFFVHHRTEQAAPPVDRGLSRPGPACVKGGADPPVNPATVRMPPDRVSDRAMVLAFVLVFGGWSSSRPCWAPVRTVCRSSAVRRRRPRTPPSRASLGRLPGECTGSAKPAAGPRGVPASSLDRDRGRGRPNA